MVDPLSVMPEQVKRRLLDAAVEALARLVDKLPGDGRPARAIRRLKTDGEFQIEFEIAVQSAVSRFLNEYSNEDADLIQQLSRKVDFWTGKILFDSLRIIVAKPGEAGVSEQQQLRDHIRSLVRPNTDPERLDRAVSSFLKYLSDEVWSITQLQPIYSLYLQRITSQHSASIADALQGIRDNSGVIAQAVLSSQKAREDYIESASQQRLELGSGLRTSPESAQKQELVERDGSLDEEPSRSKLAVYLDWITSTTSVLDIRDIGNPRLGLNVSFGLDSLFTPLYVRAGPESYDPDQSRTSLETVVQSTSRLLVTGESGSGKSTFLRYLCRVYGVQETPHAPFQVDLIDLLDEGLLQQGHRRINHELLVQAALARLDGEGLGLSVSDLVYYAERGSVIWLLDGLNELPSVESRKAVVSLIGMCASRWSGCKFILTSAPSAVHGTSIPLGFDVAEIDGWRPSDIEIFLDAWATALYPGDTAEQRRDRWEPLLTAIQNTPELRGLARNALNVTSMAVVHFNEHRLPDGRADLLGAITTWLINRRRHVLERSGFTPKEVDGAFPAVAYQMVTTEKGPLKKVGKLWAARETAYIFGGDQQRATEFFETAVEVGGGLLLGKMPGDLTFWNDSLRDYLAAKYIAGKTDDYESGWWNEISPNLDDPAWRLVVSLVPGCLAKLGTDRVDLFFERLGNSCMNQSLELRARRVALGGRVLRELYPSGYSARHVPAWTGALTSVSPIFIQPPEIDLLTRYEAAVAYGFEGDARLADEAATWAWLPGGNFLVGAQSSNPDGVNYDRDAAAWESPVREVILEAYAMRRYLVTVADYRHFVDAGGYTSSLSESWTDDGWEWRSFCQVNAPLNWEDQVLVPNAPVTGVSWFEAMAYCRWFTLRSDEYVYVLPTEIEWEYAARRGVKPGRQFPWGNRMTFGERAEANWAGCYLRRKSPVGMFPLSTNRDGVTDLFGNVEEWTMDEWTWEGPDPVLSGDFKFLEHHKPLFQTSGVQRVVRGGSTIRFSRLCRPSYRSRILQEGRYHTVGFRPIRKLCR